MDNKQYMNNTGVRLLMVFIILSISFHLYSEDIDFDRYATELYDRETDSYYLVNIQGERITDENYKEIWHDGDGLWRVIDENEHVGWIRYDGMKIPCLYIKQEWGGYFHNGVIAVQQASDNLWGCIDTLGNVRIPFKFDCCEHLNCYFPDNTDKQVFLCMKEGRIGLLDEWGNTLLPFEYNSLPNWGEFARSYSKGIIFITKGSYLGAVNLKGQIVIPFIYKPIEDQIESYFGNDADPFKNNNAIVLQRKDGMWCLINETGKTTEIGRGFEGSYLWNGDLIYLVKNGLEGFVTRDNKVVNPVFDEIDAHLAYGVVACKSKDHGSVLLSIENGKQILPYLPYDQLIFYNSENSRLFPLSVKKDNKWGFINEKGIEIIPCKYDWVTEFVFYSSTNKCYSIVRKNGKYGVIGESDNIIIPFDYDHISFNEEQQIFNVRKGEEEYYVNAQNQVAQEKAFQKSPQSNLIVKKNNLYGLVNKDNFEIIPFDYQHLKYISDDWPWNNYKSSLLSNLIKAKQNDKYGCLSAITGKVIIPCKFDRYEFDLKLHQYIYALQPSDVDQNVPNAAVPNGHTFALIISNENYGESNVSKVSFAQKDGEIFRDYCLKTLGIPEKNIHYRNDATLNQIRSELRWVNDIANAFGNEANIIFYYTGHGIPDEKGGESYLLPVDGIPADVQSAYALSELYKQLGTLPVKQVTVFLDACFSGAQRDGNMLVAAKGVAIKAKAELPQGNMVVMSASQGDETAYYYKKKRHGLFSYFLLKKLQESKGDVTLGELGEYIKREVSQYSIVNNGKSQTPSVMASPVLGDSWKNLKLK